MQASTPLEEKIKVLLDAEVEWVSGKYFVKKNRTLQICNEELCFACDLELDISFKPFEKSAMAINYAEILLLPEEVEPFTLALMNHKIAFPTSFHQWMVENPLIVSVNLETIEPPEHFAERLAAALQSVESVKNHLNLKTS